MHFKNKFVFLTALIALFFTYGFVFDGFKIAKFEYECNVKKNFKVEIVDNYTLNDLQNIWWKDSEIYKKCDWDYEKCPKNTNLIHKSNLYTNNKKFIGKIYQYYMPYNSFMHKFLSIPTNVHGKICQTATKNQIINILKQNLKGVKNE